MDECVPSIVHVAGSHRWFYLDMPCDEKEFLTYIQDKGNPEYRNEHNASALCMAVNNFQSPKLVQSLLDLGANPNRLTYIGGKNRLKKPIGTPLHAAVTLNNFKIVKSLLEGGANPNVRTSDGETPLLLSVQHPPRENSSSNVSDGSESVEKEGEALQISEILLEYGADSRILDNKGRNILHIASENGCLSALIYFFAKNCNLDVNEIGLDGVTPLLAAVTGYGTSSRIVTELLSRGANPNHGNAQGWMPLHKAVRKAELDVVHVLLKHGADPNKADSAGTTPLHLAVTFKNSLYVDIIRHLLNYKADPNIVDKCGASPLHVATEKRPLCEQTLRILLMHGADPSIRDQLGRSVHFNVAFKNSPQDTLTFLPLLLSQSCDLNIRDILGEPLLHVVLADVVRLKTDDAPALLNDFEKILHRLSIAGVNFNIQDSEGKTLLHLTAAGGNKSFVKGLIAVGADVNAVDLDGNSPAHIAAEYAHCECVQLLASGGWRDSINIRGRSVRSIVDDRISKMKGKVKNGWNPRSDWKLQQELIVILRSARTLWPRKRWTIQRDSLFDTLNEKIPVVLKARGLRSTTYPVPNCFELPIFQEETPLKEISVLNDLKAKCGLAGPLEEAKYFHPACLAQTEDAVTSLEQKLFPFIREMKSFQKSKSCKPSEFDYIPPAPMAVSHIIEDISTSCDQYSTGCFHFEDNPCDHEKCEIGCQVRSLVHDLLMSITGIDPRFRHKLHLTGSVPEGTKLWAPDEFDFMVELTEIEGQHLQTVYSALSIVVSSEQKRYWGELLDTNEHLSCIKLREYLVLLAWKASFSLRREKYGNLTFGLTRYNNSTNLHPLVSSSKVGVLLHLQWHGTEYPLLDINVDLTPAIPFREWSLTGLEPRAPPLPESLGFVKDLGYHVIPAGDTWRLSFSLAELQLIQRFSKEEMNLYKSLKLLRDIHIKTGATPSYLLKSSVFNYIFRENVKCLAGDLVLHTYNVLRNLVNDDSEIKRHFFTGLHLPEFESETAAMDWCRFSLMQLH